MAKKKKEPTKKDSAEKAVGKRDAGKKDAGKKDAGKKDAGKKDAAKKARPETPAAPTTGWDEIAASSPPRPAARAEPTSDSVLIVDGIAEIVRLGLGAMDPEQRTTLLVALGKVGASLTKNR